MGKSDDYKDLITDVKREYQENQAEHKTSKVILSFQGEVADLCEESK